MIPPSPPSKGGNVIDEWNEKYHQPFHFGDTISSDYANYRGNNIYGRGLKGEFREQTTPVRFFQGANQVANNFGLSDMHGNVFEWCEDDYHESYEGAPTDGSAWVNPEDNDVTKVIRGGSWSFDPWDCRSADRYDYSRVSRNDSLGFRVACSLPGSP